MKQHTFTSLMGGYCTDHRRKYTFLRIEGVGRSDHSIQNQAGPELLSGEEGNRTLHSPYDRYFFSGLNPP